MWINKDYPPPPTGSLNPLLVMCGPAINSVIRSLFVAFGGEGLYL